MNAPPSTVAAERHRHVVGVGAVRARCARAAASTAPSRAGPPAGSGAAGPRPARRAGPRSAAARRACRRTRPRRARRGRAGPGRRRPAATPGRSSQSRWNASTSSTVTAATEVGIAVQRAAVPLGRPEQVGAQRRVGARAGLRPVHPQRGHLVVADPGDVGRVEPRGAGGLGEQRHGGRQPVHRHRDADPERVPVDRRGQLGAQPLQGERVTRPSPGRACPPRAPWPGPPRCPRGRAVSRAAPASSSSAAVARNWPGRCAATTLPPATVRADDRSGTGTGGRRPGPGGWRRGSLRLSSGR